MKGHMEDGKFHPHKQYKGVRKSRDQSTKTQGVIIRKARGSELTDQISTFNRMSSTKIEYGSDKTGEQGLKVKGADVLIKIMTPKEAINCLKFTNWVTERNMEADK